MEPAVIITGIIGLFTTLTAFFSAKGKTSVDGKTSSRDDFSVIVDKFKEIIEYREAQILQQQNQIDVLIAENLSMKDRVKSLIDNYEEMKDILNELVMDHDVKMKIDSIYEQLQK